MPVGCITAGPKSVAQTMGAASLRHAPVPINHHFHGCTALLRFVKRRYIKYHGFTFLLFTLALPVDGCIMCCCITCSQAPITTPIGGSQNFKGLVTGMLNHRNHEGSATILRVGVQHNTASGANRTFFGLYLPCVTFWRYG